uniref:DNA recombination-mediator protein A n=1 Tax=Streptomyces sp. NBC_01393 TaxID=2903851 RepID=A0AAU3I8D7_9ACTN
MATIAVTGHMDLTEDSVPLVRDALREVLKPHAASGDLVGLSCIAKGADSIFAEVVLELGGSLAVVVPSADYRENKVKPDHAETFDRLTAAADQVDVLAHDTANRAAYEDANRTLLERADHLVAVWSGEPPSGKGGGTADTVLEARAAGLPVDVVWPEGAARRI